MKAKKLTTKPPSVAMKRKFLKWLREQNVPYVLDATGLFFLGAAVCSIDRGYLSGSFGSLISGYDTDFRCSLFLGDCFTTYNRFVFINNRFVELSHSPKSQKLAQVQLPEILALAQERA
jgi:hypothetical protein